MTIIIYALVGLEQHLEYCCESSNNESVTTTLSD